MGVGAGRGPGGACGLFATSTPNCFRSASGHDAPCGILLSPRPSSSAGSASCLGRSPSPPSRHRLSLFLIIRSFLLLPSRLSFLSIPTLLPTMSDSPPLLNPFDDAGGRSSKASVSPSPSVQGSTFRMLSDRSSGPFPSIARRLTSYGSNPSLSAASDSPYLGTSRPLSLGDQVRPSPPPGHALPSHSNATIPSTPSHQTPQHGEPAFYPRTRKKTTISTDRIRRPRGSEYGPTMAGTSSHPEVSLT